MSRALPRAGPTPVELRPESGPAGGREAKRMPAARRFVVSVR